MGDGDTMTAEHRELWERIKKVRPAMMTTVESDGSFRSRPMWTQGTSSTEPSGSSSPTTGRSPASSNGILR
jgi:general stress protein 26